jgi:hypothetical protein
MTHKQSDDLAILFSRQDQEARWKAEVENATARLEIAKMNKHCAYLISQHEPVASLGLDRARLRLVLAYIRHGDLSRLTRDFEELRVDQARKEVK